jgi:hypothetical protein
LRTVELILLLLVRTFDPFLAFGVEISFRDVVNGLLDQRRLGREDVIDEEVPESRSDSREEPAVGIEAVSSASSRLRIVRKRTNLKR